MKINAVSALTYGTLLSSQVTDAHSQKGLKKPLLLGQRPNLLRGQVRGQTAGRAPSRGLGICSTSINVRFTARAKLYATLGNKVKSGYFWLFFRQILDFYPVFKGAI